MKPGFPALALALGAMALAPAMAAPATYPVLACGPAAGGANLSWTPSNSAPGTLAGSQSCPAPGSLGGLLVTDVIAGPILTPPSARAEWTFTAPPGLLVSAISGQRWLLTQIDDQWVAYIREGSGRHLEECRTGPGLSVCQSAGALYPPEPVPFRHEGLATQSVSIGIACTGAGCITGSSTHRAGASLQDVRVDLVDGAAATVTAQTGPLREAAGGPWLRGTQTLAVAATDAGGGVAGLGVALTQGPDTRIGAYRSIPCDYRLPAPCPPVGAAELAIDTAALPDGAHTVHAFADDATVITSLDNRGLGAAFGVRVDNTPPPPPALRADDPPLAGAAFRVLADPGAQEPGSPIAHLDWTLTPADGGPGALSGRSAPEPLILVAPRPGAWTVSVTAIDQAGNSGPAASLALAVRPAPALSKAPEDAGGFPGLRLRLAERARPVAGRRVRELRPRLSWPAVGGARGYQVHLLWVRPDGALARVAQERVRAARYRPGVGPLRSGRRYLWRVWPIGANGKPGELHAASVFDVGLGFARPRAGTVTARLRPVLRWRAQPGVRRHELRLYRIGPGGRGLRPIARARIAGARYRVAPGTLRAGGRYLWLVRPARAGAPLLASSFFRVAPKATRAG